MGFTATPTPSECVGADYFAEVRLHRPTPSSGSGGSAAAGRPTRPKAIALGSHGIIPSHRIVAAKRGLGADVVSGFFREFSVITTKRLESGTCDHARPWSHGSDRRGVSFFSRDNSEKPET